MSKYDAELLERALRGVHALAKDAGSKVYTEALTSPNYEVAKLVEDILGEDALWKAEKPAKFGWVAFEDEDPPVGEDVLVRHRRGGVMYATCYTDVVTDLMNNTWPRKDVTHWSAVPEPGQEDHLKTTTQPKVVLRSEDRQKVLGHVLLFDYDPKSWVPEDGADVEIQRRSDGNFFAVTYQKDRGFVGSMLDRVYDDVHRWRYPATTKAETPQRTEPYWRSVETDGYPKESGTYLIIDQAEEVETAVHVRGTRTFSCDDLSPAMYWMPYPDLPERE